MRTLRKFRWHILLLIALVGPTVVGVCLYGLRGAENREKRELAENPFTQEDTTVANLPERLETYYEDHLPLKTEIAGAQSTVEMTIFNESSNPDVVVGKDNWLYFNSVEHGDPLQDYLGNKLFTEEEEDTISQYVNAANEYFSYAGTKFVFAIVPGKERVYPQYLPDEYGEAQPGRGIQMYDYLTEHCPGVEVVWLLDDLKDYSDTHEELTYFKTDSHWNHLGAYIGAKRILEEAGFTNLPEPTEEFLTEFNPGGGDLVDLLGVNPDTVQDVDYELTGDLSFPFTSMEGDTMSRVDFTSDSDSGKTAVILGDSFTIILSEELAGHFTEMCYYRRYGSSDENIWDIIDTIKPDVFIYETADRYLDQVGILASPLRLPGFYAEHPELEYGTAGKEVTPIEQEEVAPVPAE